MLCLGEAVVDLIGEEPVRAIGEVGRFAPHLGGTVANVAAFAARTGAPVALAGGAGDDDWGRWLVRRLAAEGVDVTRFRLLAGAPTQLAFCAVDAHGEPTYLLYRELAETVVDAVGGAERADTPAAPARVVSTIGAGDAFTGTLVARLVLSGFYAPAVAAAMGEAAVAAAQACERWGALD